jgi:uncharacterized protein (DUF4415 family)
MSAEQARKARLTRAQKRRLDAMTDADITAAAKADPDNPPLSERDFTLMAQARGVGRPAMPASERRQSITLRLPREVIAHFRAGGPGWQTRMGEVLARASRRK